MFSWFCKLSKRADGKQNGLLTLSELVAKSGMQPDVWTWLIDLACSSEESSDETETVHLQKPQPMSETQHHFPLFLFLCCLKQPSSLPAPEGS